MIENCTSLANYNFFFMKGGERGGGADKLYRYVQRQRVWFFLDFLVSNRV